MSAAAAVPLSMRRGFDLERVRADFPALRQSVHGKPLVYLDSAATALKPQAVIDALVRYYSSDSANVHRGVHLLSQRATDAFEAAREQVRSLLNARETVEIVFLRGVTEAMNLLAGTLGQRLGAGDEVLLTELEHHSNIVPWQMVCQARGARLVVAPITDSGEVEVGPVAEKIGRARKSSRWRTPRTHSARSCRSKRLRGSRTSGARSWSSTARKEPHIYMSTCRTSTSTFTRSADTSSTDRPASARSTANMRTSPPCRPSTAAAR